MRGSAPVLSLAIGVIVGCQGSAAPLPQYLVTVSTDAPVPQLGDRLLVQLLDDSGNPCSGCERELDASSPTQLPVSFGVVPPPGASALHVYARLYRHGVVSGAGVPLDDAYLDGSALLPPAEGVVSVSLALSSSCFGVHAAPSAHQTCNPDTRSLVAEPLAATGEALVTGSWASAAPSPCTGSVPAGMICVPGGLLLMGSAVAPPAPADYVPVPEHLITLRPFAMDAVETTVKDVRQLLASGALSSQDVPVTQSANPGCTYLASGANDGMPVNCVTFAQANAICAAVGKRLPSEAEWEMAARNGSAQTTYPWGEDTDVCEYAVVGRSSILAPTTNVYDDICRTELQPPPPVGPAAGGAPSDRSTLMIQDLGGNMTEWTSDAFAPYGDSCWTGGDPVLDNPVCRQASSAHAGEQTVRGGSWAEAPSFLTDGAARSSELGTSYDPTIGVRCAKSM